MPLNIKLLENGIDTIEKLVKAIVVPTDSTLSKPILSSGEKLYDEAGDILGSILMGQGKVEVGKVFVSSGYNLRKLKGIEHIIHAVVPSFNEDTKGMEAVLVAYYQSSLKAAVDKKIVSLALPIIGTNGKSSNIKKQAINIAFEFVQNFANENSQIEIYLIFESTVDHNLLLNIQNDSATSCEEFKKNMRDESVLTSKVNFEGIIFSPVVPKMIGNKLPLKIPECNSPKELPASPNSWDNRSDEKIQDAVKSFKGDLNELRFLLGPAFNSIQSQYENGALDAIVWKFYKAETKRKFQEKFLQGIDVYSRYLKYKAVFSQEDEAETSEQGKKFNSLKKTHPNEIVTIEKYLNNWIDAYSGSLSIRLIESKLKSITNKDVLKLTGETKDRFRSLITEWLDKEMEQEFCKDNLMDGNIKKMHLSFIKSFKEALIADWPKESCLEILCSNISDELVVTNKEIRQLELKYKKSVATYSIEMQVEAKRYRKSAEIWLSDNINYESMKEMLFSEEIAGFKGRTVNELIDDIINYSTIRTMQTKGIKWVDNTFKIAPTDKIEVALELEKSFFSPRFEKTRDVAKKIHKLIKKVKDNFENTQDQDEKDACNIIITDTRRWMSAWISNPLGWAKLKQILEYLSCKSEAQQDLKMKLLKYIDTRSIRQELMNIVYDEDELLERRRQVEYLVSCLYSASALELDEGILFSSPSNNDSEMVGVNLIINNLTLDKIKSSNLRKHLNSYINDIKDKSILYLSSSGNAKSFIEAHEAIKSDEMLYLTTRKNNFDIATHESKPEMLTESSSMTTRLGFFSHSNNRLIDSSVSNLQNPKMLSIN